MPLAARVLLVLAFLLALPFAGSDVARAAGGDSPPSGARSAHPAEYDAGLALVERGEFAQARRAFERAAKKSPRDPEVLNMLAYSQRKSGQLDRAIETYKQALALRPDFAQAREYLGEAYLQAALRELQTLAGYGPEAEDERAKLTQALQDAASAVSASREASAKHRW